MYIRIKRRKQTFFISCAPTDSILEVKNKLQPLIDLPPQNIQLKKNDLLLEDAKFIGDLQVVNDDIIAMSLLKEDGEWDEPAIVMPGAEQGEQEDGEPPS
ncbi:unnamed protein product [Pedinophyceae sp. YPF-701]|nr:unnamed protein product [Pedinophyceae sp. YPF-701]